MTNRIPTPPLSDERVDQLWRANASRILPKDRAATTRRQVVLALAAGLVAVVGVGLAARLRSPAPLSEGAQVLGPAEVALVDQSSVTVERDARLSVEETKADRVQVSLTGGRARFEVAKNKGRDFHVLTRGVDVHVVGTRFVVEDLGDAVLVSVESGIVEVRSGAELRRLTAGQSWRAGVPVASAALPPAAVTSPNEAPAAVEPTAPPPTPAQPVSPQPAQAPSVKSHGPAKHAPGRTAATASTPEPLPVIPTSAPQEPSADELFAAALEARRTHPENASSAWAAFLKAFPHEARAGLASFELGRLQMDVERAPARASESLERAVTLAPNAAFVEDALARLVHLQDQRHDVAACHAARDRYFARFPRGTYVTSLAPLCAP